GGRLLAFKVKQLTSFVEAIGSRAGSGLPILADQATGRSFRALPPPSWPPIHPPGATDDSTDRAATLRLLRRSFGAGGSSVRRFRRPRRPRSAPAAAGRPAPAGHRPPAARRAGRAPPPAGPGRADDGPGPSTG